MPPGCSGEICVNLAPAMYKLQITGTADGDDDHGQQQHHNAERIGSHSVQSLGSNHCAERYADEHEYRAHQQRRDEHRSAGKSSASDRKDRA